VTTPDKCAFVVAELGVSADRGRSVEGHGSLFSSRGVLARLVTMLVGKESSSARGDSIVRTEFGSFLGFLEFSPLGWISLKFELGFPFKGLASFPSLKFAHFAELRGTLLDFVSFAWLL
jgi:hypothetical protein